MPHRTATAPWRDRSLSIEQRVESLVAEMHLDEKLAQLYGVWVGAAADGGDVAPHQHEMDDEIDLDALLPSGLGQLTRPFGSAPVDAAVGALSLARTQARIVESSRLGIPAIAHEECLAGFAAWGATAYPVPLSWGAAFDPELVERMARQIGDDMRSVGVHQGLAPVLDVVRDARWGRVEETIGEDPHLVGAVGTAYVRGLEQSGIVATLKHFVGYSASRAGRNLAPVSIGRRELAEVLLPPFERAVREGGARSVMNSYSDVDGVPAAADRALLTELLREKWGFEGTVVADYFAIAFLRLLHGSASTWAEAAALALEAGIDVELPTVKTFGAPLRDAVEAGIVAESLIDTALRRVLRQKAELGLLDEGWNARPPALADLDERGASDRDADALRGSINLDPASNRELARELAEQAVVLVRNDGVLPLGASSPGAPSSIAVIGPNADERYAMLGCYSFPTHVVSRHEGVPMGIEIPTVLESLRGEFAGASIEYARGTGVDDGEVSGIAEAVELASRSAVAIVVLGDRAGLFGRGTSGEGCDAEHLGLPGAQQQLLDAVLGTGTPTIVVLLTGRPYAIDTTAGDPGAIVQSFFPGEEGGPAIARVLSGAVEPAGRLPVSIPATPWSHPGSYLSAPLAQRSGVSNIDPTAAYAFGHGLGYARTTWRAAESGLLASPSASFTAEGSARLSFEIVNDSDRVAREVVQLYVHDPVASVVRPVQRLIGFARVDVAAGQTVQVEVDAPLELSAFPGRDERWVVEPGELVLGIGLSSSDIPLTATVRVEGAALLLESSPRSSAVFSTRILSS